MDGGLVVLLRVSLASSTFFFYAREKDVLRQLPGSGNERFGKFGRPLKEQKGSAKGTNEEEEGGVWGVWSTGWMSLTEKRVWLPSSLVCKERRLGSVMRNAVFDSDATLSGCGQHIAHVTVGENKGGELGRHAGSHNIAMGDGGL
ncbi:hypothetical protein LZ30DRAFT_455962 [Colletotrichum cereale]|nr:hypothetical protein LZ30DRAFT_455962 [Colletotrichum cereale]